MRNLKFVGTRSKFTTVPKTASGFHCHDINSAGNEANNPARNVVNAFKSHIEFDYIPKPIGMANIISLCFAPVSLKLFMIFLHRKIGIDCFTVFWVLQIRISESIQIAANVKTLNSKTYLCN